MPITVDQMWGDTEEIGISDGSASLPFVCMGTESPLAARTAIYGKLMELGYNQTYHELSLMNVSLNRQSPSIFFATCRYNRILNKMKFSFDCTAEKTKKTKSLRTIANIQVRDVAGLGWAGPDFGGLVNVGKDRVEGVDVYDPGSADKLTIQWSAKYQDLRSDYIETARGMKATVNDTDIALNYNGQSLLFPRGTLLFPGAVFDESLNDTADITLKFESSKNAENLWIGEVDGIGSTYVWQTTGDTFTGSAQITGMVDTSTLITGMMITGVDVPLGAFIVSIDSDTAITISAACTGTTGDAALEIWLQEIPKLGQQYIWIRTAKVPDEATGLTVDRPDSVHIEEFYEYDDFTKLEVFDAVDGFNDELQSILEQLQEEEEA